MVETEKTVYVTSDELESNQQPLYTNYCSQRYKYEYHGLKFNLYFTHSIIEDFIPIMYGKTIQLCGASGSGKTSVAQMYLWFTG